MLNGGEGLFLNRVLLAFTLCFMLTISFDPSQKLLKSPNNLKVHLQTHLDQQSQSVECKICSREFWNRPSLRSHVRRSHSGKSGHECRICAKSFVLAATLERHMKKIHKPELKNVKLENEEQEEKSMTSPAPVTSVFVKEEVSEWEINLE